MAPTNVDDAYGNAALDAGQDCGQIPKGCATVSPLFGRRRLEQRASPAGPGIPWVRARRSCCSVPVHRPDAKIVASLLQGGERLFSRLASQRHAVTETPDRAVRRMALFYLVFYGGGGLYFPYLVLYLGQHHASPAALGLIAAIGPAVGLIAQPLWGHLADRRRAPVALLRRLLVASALLIGIVPLLPVPWGAALGLAAYAAFSSPVVALADSSTMRFLAQAHGSGGVSAYPRVRAYGSLSFAVAAIATSAVYADQGLWRAFVGMGTGCLFCALFVLPASEPLSAGLAGVQTESPVREGPAPVLRGLLAIPGYAVVVVSAFLLQAANAAHSTFFPVYLLAVHMPASLVGMPWAAAALVEVPMFALMPVIARRFGTERLVLVSLVMYAVRFFLFSVIHIAWPVLAIQLLQGVTFTFFTGGMVVLVGSMLPSGWKAVGQTAFMAVAYSLGAIVGNLGGAWAVGAIGVFGLYRMAMVAALASAAVFAFGLRSWRHSALGATARVAAAGDA